MSINFFETNFAKSCKFKWDMSKKIINIDQWQILSKNFEEFQNEEIQIKELQKIPKRIHQIWVGNKKIPKKYLQWGKTWKKYNPEWEYKLWTNKELNAISMQNRSIYESTKNIGFKSDIARYEILYKFGGIYIDTDFECLSKIPEKLLHYDFISCLGFNYRPVILNGFLMASTKSYFIKELMNSICIPKNTSDPMSIIDSSGPNKLTKIYFKNHKYGKYLILPSNYCYPYPSFLINSAVHIKDEITEETFAIHHWEMSWMKGNLILRIIKKLISFIR